MARINAQFDEFNRKVRQAEAELRANPYHPDPSEDPAIESVLRAARPEAWRRLWSAVDEILTEDPESQASWRFENSDGSLSMPHVDYSNAIHRMTEALYDVDAIVNFPWMKWDFKSAYPGGWGLDTAPVADAARVLTAVIRAERFNDGTILAALSDGTLLSALQRLRTWYEQHANQ
ncbi:MULTISPECIES: DUF6508 domain-containing protein [unclassified Nocardia]|uniref:DUF6508 domain-containing protein n=1 Tax=unclassified Nocardia TaxID=2637762 RepID=UPI001CE3F5BF|nr:MULTISPECIES: DUF6508 domain-containing protein [unclassified Nocardia]